MAHAGFWRWLLTGCCVLVGLYPTTHAGECSYPRFRATLAGFVQATASPASGVTVFGTNTKQSTLPFPVRQALLLGASLVSEGGLSIPVAKKTLLLDNSVASRLEHAEGVARTGSMVRNWQSTGLLRLIPITLAYLSIPQERTRAAGVCLELSRQVTPEMRKAAKAYSELLAYILISTETDSDQLLQTLIRTCDDPDMVFLFKQVRADSLFDVEGEAPEDIIGSVISAWAHATSFENALARLGRSPGLVRKGLCGALAGAWFGIRHIPSQIRLDATSNMLLAQVTTGLHDLANDGILLPITTSSPETMLADAEEAASLNGDGVDSLGLSKQADAGDEGRFVTKPSQHTSRDSLEPMAAMSPMEPMSDMLSNDSMLSMEPMSISDDMGVSEQPGRRFQASSSHSMTIPEMPSLPSLPEVSDMPRPSTYDNAPASGLPQRTKRVAPSSNILDVGGIAETERLGARPLFRRSSSIAGTLTSLK